MNAAEPDWQKQFKALAGEKETLEELAATPVEKLIQNIKRILKSCKSR